MQGVIVGLILMIGALVVETSLFTIHLSQVDMKKEKDTKKALAHENQERISGGYLFLNFYYFYFFFIII